MQNLRIGILSTASIVPRFINASRQVEDCTVTAIASRDPEKAREKAALWQIPGVFSSYEELLASPDIDAVYIALINSAHYAFARRALEQGKHVLCEKPLALDPAEIWELFSLAREKGLFLMEMQKCVFLPVIQQLKERIRSGEFGTITMADFSNSFDAGYNSWMFDASKGGGPLFSHAIYSLQLMQYLFDSFVVEQTGLCTRSVSAVENQFSAVMLLENGILFTNKTSTASDTIPTGYLYGERGYIELPDYWKARKAILHFKDREPEVLEIPCDYELQYETRHAVSCIRQGLTESPVMTEEMSARAADTLLQLHRQWNGGN